VVGNFKHLNNHQYLRKYSALLYFYCKNSNVYYWFMYQYYFKKSHYIYIILSCLNLVLNKLKKTEQ
jgi:hypothetical protein